MCSGRRCRSTDMQHDLFGSGQIVNMTFQVQVIVHSTRLDERNTMLVKESSCKVKSSKVKLSQKLLQKNGFRKARLFWQFLPPGGETFDGRSNLRVLLRKSVNPRTIRPFLITRTTRGGCYDPPWRFETEGRRA